MKNTLDEKELVFVGTIAEESLFTVDDKGSKAIGTREMWNMVWSSEKQTEAMAGAFANVLQEIDVFLKALESCGHGGSAQMLKKAILDKLEEYKKLEKEIIEHATLGNS